jgi:hypothetical protein
LAQVVGSVSTALARIKREEAEVARANKPPEFPTEKAIRTEEGALP